MADGNLLVNAEENDEIRLVFDGFSIASADIAPIYVSQCGSCLLYTSFGGQQHFKGYHHSEIIICIGGFVKVIKIIIVA